jgi:hypothetical protein
MSSNQFTTAEFSRWKTIQVIGKISSTQTLHSNVPTGLAIPVCRLKRQMQEKWARCEDWTTHRRPQKRERISWILRGGEGYAARLALPVIP